MGRPGVYAEGLISGSGVLLSGTFDVNSKYIWRGFTVYDNPVLQPGLNLEGYGVSLSIWSSMPVLGDNESWPSDEIDLTLGYCAEFEPISISIGYLSYCYPYSDNLVTHEIYASATSDTLLPLELGITYSIDPGDSEGAQANYWSFDASKSFTVGSEIDMTLSLHYGLLRNYAFDSASGNGSDLLLTLKSNLLLDDKVSLTPSISYACPMGDLADENLGAQKAKVFGGLSFAFGD